MLSFDDRKAAITALKVLLQQLSFVDKDQDYWIWVVISLHNALQGFMVLALAPSGGHTVLSDGQAKKFTRFLELSDEEQTDDEVKKFVGLGYLKHFDALYEDIQSDNMKKFIGTKPFKPTASQSKSISKLNKYRGDFIHFFPKTILTTKDEMLQIVEDSVSAIAFLVKQSGNVFRTSQGQLDTANELIAQIESKVAEIS